MPLRTRAASADRVAPAVEARAEEYPNLVSVGRVLAEATVEERFEFALETFLAGLANR